MRVDSSFLLAHAFHLGLVLLVAGVSPLYVISIDNPTHQGVCLAESRYKVECSAFQGRAINYKGETVCTGSCTSVIERANSGECESEADQSDKCKAWLGMSNELLLFSEQATSFCIVIFVFSAIFFSLLCAAFLAREHAAPLFSAATFLMLVASLAAAVPFIYTISQVVAYTEVKTSVNVGQTVQISAATPLIGLLPVTTLLLLQGISLWSA